jgi:hypothetical protein
MRDAAKLQRSLLWAVLLAESTHVFCCVLPTLVTVMALMASVGAMAQLPAFILDIHDLLHAYEIPVIIFSGLTLLLGWGVYGLARRIECQKDHCEPHETTCAPAKNNTHVVLMVASVLFLVNVTVYWTLHRRSEDLLHAAGAQAHHHDDHGHAH